MIVDDNDPNSPFTSYGYSYAGSPYKVSNVRFYFVSFKPDHVLQQQQYVVTVRLFDRGAFSAATPDVLFTLTLDVELPDANPPSFAAAAGLFAENVTVTAIQTNGGGFVAAESDGEPPYRRNAAFHGRDVLYPHTYETGHAAVISITQNAEHFMEIVLPSNANSTDYLAEGDRTSERRHACNNLATDEFWIDANGAETNQVNQARRFNPSPPNSGS